MTKATRETTKPRTPTLATAGKPAVVRLQPDVAKAIDDWRRKQDDQPNRADAIRRLVELGFSVKSPRVPGNHQARAAELAGKQIDRMNDAAAPADERATRKRRLTSGPPEFRDVRKDQAKGKRSK